jgi:hypothetical protein
MIAQPQLTRYHEKNRKRMETATGWLCTLVVSDREGEGERGREGERYSVKKKSRCSSTSFRGFLVM